MVVTTSQSSSSPVSYRRVLTAIRDQIISGEYAPGARLPTRQAMGEQFSTTIVTVQRALARLRDQGFVIPRGRAGTFVVDHPPHMNNYGVVFWHSPSELPAAWTRYDAAFDQQASRLPLLRPGTTVEKYYLVKSGLDSDGMRRLLTDINQQRLAGLIFVNPPYELEETDILQAPNLPRVCLARESVLNVAAVNMHWSGMISRGLDYLRDVGCQRVAVMTSSQGVLTDRINLVRDLSERAAIRGLEIKPSWILPFPHAEPQTARYVAQLLMDNEPHRRPDGILVADDHIVEQLTLGLRDAGVMVPQQVQVVGHCNYPSLPEAAVPIKRLGFDAEAVLRKCLEVLDAQRDDKPVQPLTVISPVFDHELSQRTTVESHAAASV